jgi:pimeloyl-ACP methyl ester carboxylesterase
MISRSARGALRKTCAGVAIAAVLPLSACVFAQARRDRQFHEALVGIHLRVEVENWSGAPIVVVVARLPEEAVKPSLVVTHVQSLREPDSLSVLLEPGSYLVGVVEDTNGNQAHDDGERGVLSEQIILNTGEAPPEITLVVSKVFDRKSLGPYEAIEELQLALGDVLPLDDPKFGPKVARFGLWQPTRHALTTRPGIYMLEPYDPDRTPVLFVHGMAGYPQNFEVMIDALDRDRFQPWVFLYPAGYSLGPVARALRHIVIHLEIRHGFDRLCVVAHSMGGLVARGFLKADARLGETHSVRVLVTIASPLGGMPSAGRGVRMAPEVVRSWIDLAPGSEYLRTLYTEPLPDETEYHLLFAYKDSGASDGTVGLPSQIRGDAQAESTVMRGFEATHVGALRSDAVIAHVNAALDACQSR